MNVSDVSKLLFRSIRVLSVIDWPSHPSWHVPQWLMFDQFQSLLSFFLASRKHTCVCQQRNTETRNTHIHREQQARKSERETKEKKKKRTEKQNCTTTTNNMDKNDEEWYQRREQDEHARAVSEKHTQQTRKKGVQKEWKKEQERESEKEVDGAHCVSSPPLRAKSFVRIERSKGGESVCALRTKDIITKIHAMMQTRTTTTSMAIVYDDGAFYFFDDVDVDHQLDVTKCSSVSARQTESSMNVTDSDYWRVESVYDGGDGGDGDGDFYDGGDDGDVCALSSSFSSCDVLLWKMEKRAVELPWPSSVEKRTAVGQGRVEEEVVGASGSLERLGLRRDGLFSLPVHRVPTGCRRHHHHCDCRNSKSMRVHSVWRTVQMFLWSASTGMRSIVHWIGRW